MEQREMSLLERRTGINKAFGRMYFAIYSIDLARGDYVEIETLDIFREKIPPVGEMQLLFDMVVKYYVSDGYKDGMHAFLDMDTLQERLSEQNAVSNEFFGTTQGWCRASLVVEKRDEDGRVVRFAYVTQEINEEVKTEQERIAQLKGAYEAVDAANHAKTDFLFRMSHDIRTPLNAIMGFDHLLACRADDAARVREYAEKIRISGELLLSLLNEILDMTKIESGNAQLAPVSFGLGELIDELDMVIRTQTDQKRQTFTVTRDVHGEDGFYGDRARLSRILFNILSNAVKYTEPGGEISFCIREEEADETQATLVFSVKDNGIGMEPELAGRVFDEFTRGTDETVNKIPGTGLGLSIAKSFTELMGGEIAVTSESGKGSEFTVRMPLTRCALAPQEADDAQKDMPDLSGLHLLVVEDNELNMQIVTEILAMDGITCEKAYSGRQALALMEQAPPDAFDMILMDVRMPGMDGYETTKRLRKMERPDVKTVPIIALTANAFEEDMENAKRAGMDAHLAKPLDVAAFRKTAAALLHRQ